MERLTDFFPAFDKRDPDPAKNYGIHGVQMRMALKGELGVVHFVLYTNWQLPHVQEEWDKKPPPSILFKPLPADLGYHSPKPMFEGQKISGSTKLDFKNKKKIEIGDSALEMPGVIEIPIEDIPVCDMLGVHCYCDGSALGAQRIFNILLEKGSAGVWEELEAYYTDTFGELK